MHNDGFRLGRKLASAPSSPRASISTPPLALTDAQIQSATQPKRKAPPTYFSAQSYLRYQGDKFVKRFDPNCYIAITRKLDTHDVSRGRVPVAEGSSSPGNVFNALAMIQQPTLVIGIESDGLFTFQEQQELATYIPNARLKRIDSPEGHDAFLIQFQEVNEHIIEFLREIFPNTYTEKGVVMAEEELQANGAEGTTDKKGGLVTEVDDITAW